MTIHVTADETRMVLTDEDGSDDEMVLAVTQTGALNISIAEPRAGDTVSGFGARTAIWLDREAALRLRDWLTKALA